MQFGQVNRRELTTLLVGVAGALPLAARAQQTNRIKRIGVLFGFPKDIPEQQARLAAFLQALEKLGWTDGRNVRIDIRYAPAGAQAPVLVKELVALQPDVIVAHSTPIAARFQQETRTIPIVFVAVSNPIASGFIASMARPGGNLTGLMLYDASVTGKWLTMLKEIAPRLTRAAFLANPKITLDYWLQAAKPLALVLAIDLVPSPVESAADIERAIDSLSRAPDSGLILPPDFSTAVHRELISALAARHRLPAVYSDSNFVTAGGLMSYGIDIVDLFGQAASYVDRILRGANPAELPVQAPTKFKTVLNLKAAKALGLTVPDKLLVAADEVIE